MRFRVPPALSASILLTSALFAVATISGAQTTAQCSFKTFQLPSGYSSASPADINNNGTIVGTVVSPVVNSTSFLRGLQRNPDGSMSSNGSFVTLQYPGTQDTWPRGINNHGTIVGTAGGHGFIYHGGTWAKVVFPQSASVNGTQLFGISNNNVIVGQAGSSPPTSFLYVNGVFKIILAPNSSNTQVQGISGDGLITGIAFINGVNVGQGFLATCR